MAAIAAVAAMAGGTQSTGGPGSSLGKLIEPAASSKRQRVTQRTEGVQAGAALRLLLLSKQKGALAISRNESPIGFVVNRAFIASLQDKDAAQRCEIERLRCENAQLRAAASGVPAAWGAPLFAAAAAPCFAPRLERVALGVPIHSVGQAPQRDFGAMSQSDDSEASSSAC